MEKMPEDADGRRQTPSEFSVRSSWLGRRLILRVRRFDQLPYSGVWQDAQPRDLPAFFYYMLKGRQP